MSNSVGNQFPKLTTPQFGQYLIDKKLPKEQQNALQAIRTKHHAAGAFGRQLEKEGIHLKFEPHPQHETFIKLTAVDAKGKPLPLPSNKDEFVAYFGPETPHQDRLEEEIWQAAGLMLTQKLLQKPEGLRKKPS